MLRHFRKRARLFHLFSKKIYNNSFAHFCLSHQLLGVVQFQQGKIFIIFCGKNSRNISPRNINLSAAHFLPFPTDTSWALCHFRRLLWLPLLPWAQFSAQRRAAHAGEERRRKIKEMCKLTKFERNWLQTLSTSDYPVSTLL